MPWEAVGWSRRKASLETASGASHHVWSSPWAVSRPTQLRRGHTDSSESASAVCMRAVVTWRDHEQEWSPGRRVHGRRGMPGRWVVGVEICSAGTWPWYTTVTTAYTAATLCVLQCTRSYTCSLSQTFSSGEPGTATTGQFPGFLPREVWLPCLSDDEPLLHAARSRVLLSR